jgi:hypothetical protein
LGSGSRRVTDEHRVYWATFHPLEIDNGGR